MCVCVSTPVSKEHDHSIATLKQGAEGSPVVASANEARHDQVNVPKHGASGRFIVSQLVTTFLPVGTVDNGVHSNFKCQCALFKLVADSATCPCPQPQGLLAVTLEFTS